MVKVEVPCLCKDCDYSELSYTCNNGLKVYYCYHWKYETGMSPNEVEEDDFCSYAKPKE